MRVPSVLLFVGGVAFSACGGTVTSIEGGQDSGASRDGGGGGDDAQPRDSSLGDTELPDAGAADGAPCPETPPSIGDPCFNAGPGVQCEYGTNWYGECDLVFICRLDGEDRLGWIIEYDGGSCDYTTGGGCPPTFGGVPQGGSCGSSNLSCDYPEAHCDCLGFCGGPPPPPDASTGPTWKCSQLDEGCPPERPRLGTPCAPGPVNSCSYSICCAGTFMECDGGYWQGTISQGGCP